MPKLVIADNECRPIREVNLSDSLKLTIGRARRSDVIVTDPGLSRTHCVIYIEQDRWYIVDAASASGTFVNGERVRRMRLEEDSIVEIGNIRLWLDRSADRFGERAIEQMNGQDAAAPANDHPASHGTRKPDPDQPVRPQIRPAKIERPASSAFLRSPDDWLPGEKPRQRKRDGSRNRTTEHTDNHSSDAR